MQRFRIPCLAIEVSKFFFTTKCKVPYLIYNFSEKEILKFRIIQRVHVIEQNNVSNAES